MKLIVPLLAAALFIYALCKRVDPYSAFAEGAAEAVPVILKVLPYLGAMLLAINLFRRSGAMDALENALAPLVRAVGIPSELVPLVILRPFSGSAELALLRDTLLAHGADTFIGCAASALVGSTETIFYTISLYCGSIGVKRTRYAVPVALIAGLAGAVSAVLFVRILLFR